VQSHGGLWHKWQGRAESLGWGDLSRTPPARNAIEAKQNYLNGACMMMDRRFVKAAGPMREDYFLYCEEIDWCLRGLRQGMTLGFTPHAEILHHQGTTVGGFEDVRKRKRLPIHLGERNRILLTREFFPLCLPAVILFAILLIFYRYALAGAWRQFLYGLAGLSAGIKGERGKPRWVLDAQRATKPL